MNRIRPLYAHQANYHLVRLRSMRFMYQYRDMEYVIYLNGILKNFSTAIEKESSQNVNDKIGTNSYTNNSIPFYLCIARNKKNCVTPNGCENSSYRSEQIESFDDSNNNPMINNVFFLSHFFYSLHRNRIWKYLLNMESSLVYSSHIELMLLL